MIQLDVPDIVDDLRGLDSGSQHCAQHGAVPCAATAAHVRQLPAAAVHVAAPDAAAPTSRTPAKEGFDWMRSRFTAGDDVLIAKSKLIHRLLVENLQMLLPPLPELLQRKDLIG